MAREDNVKTVKKKSVESFQSFEISKETKQLVYLHPCKVEINTLMCLTLLIHN